MIEFQQSEQIAVRRRWILVLVDSTDGVTGLTGQTGQVYIAKNGGTPALSTNSIVEVDSTNMPGHYYIELTAGELDTLGFISIVKKTASSLAFHDRGLVSYNNPYVSVGGFSGGGGRSGISKEQAKLLLEDIRKIVKEEVEKIEMPEMPEIPEMPEMPDHSEEIKMMMQSMDMLKIGVNEMKDMMEPMMKKDKKMTEMFNDMQGKVSDLLKSFEKVIGKFTDSSKNFEGKMQTATEEINSSLQEVDNIKSGFKDLTQEMQKFGSTLAEQTDLDKRFAAINGKMKDQALENITKKIVELGKLIIDLKYNFNKESLKKG